MRWVEKVLRVIEEEIQNSAFQEVIQDAVSQDNGNFSTDGGVAWATEHSEESSIINEILDNSWTSPAASALSAGARELADELSTEVKEVLPNTVLSGALRNPTRIPVILKKDWLAIQNGHPDLVELVTAIQETREGITMAKVSQSLPRTASPKTIINALNNAVIHQRVSSRGITSSLLQAAHWNSKQKKAGHGQPHGRYMSPSFQVFYPKRSDDRTSSDGSPLFSPIEAPQAYLYVSFLHGFS
jgi:hypothetical protein